MNTKSADLIGGDDAHPASGNIKIEEGALKLVDVQISEAPDARVLLAKDFDETSGVRLGPLKSFTGSHEYAIPAGVDAADYNTALIWCDQFNVPIGKAQF
jgi:hypothetical protein